MKKSKYLNLKEYLILITKILPLFVNHKHESYVCNTSQYKACYIWIYTKKGDSDSLIYSQFNVICNLLEDYYDVNCTIHEDKIKNNTTVSINYEQTV